MGGSRAPGQVVMMPEKKPAAQTFLQVTPQTSFQALAESMKRIEQETNKLRQERYDQVGTDKQIGERVAGRRVQEIASYLASLPTGQDRPIGFQKTPRPFDIQSTPQGTATVPTTQIAPSQPAPTTTSTGPNKYQAAVDAAAVRLADATSAYTKAKKLAADEEATGRPQGTISPTPEWAKIEDKDWQPRKIEV